MADPIGAKLKFLQLVPINPSQAPPGSLYIDITNSNAISYKDPLGGYGEIGGGGGGGGGSSYFTKIMQAGEVFPNKSPLAKLPNGKVVNASSDDITRQNICGYALEEATSPDQYIVVLLIGPNLIDALDGFGFVPGEDIYLNEFGTYTNDPNDVPIGQDLVKVGIADCESASASSTAKDLIAFTEIVARS